MSIHEHLPPQARRELKGVGWTKGLELAKVARRDERSVQGGGGKGTDGAGIGTVGDHLPQAVQDHIPVIEQAIETAL